MFGQRWQGVEHWHRVQKVSRGLYYRFADRQFPGEARLWSELHPEDKQDWLERAEAHVRKEKRAGKELPYA